MDDLNRISIGIDVSDHTACVCVMDRSGVLEEFKVRLDEVSIRTRVPFVAPDSGVVVFETGPRSAWLKRVFESLGMRVVVADARKLESISKSPTKTDRNDARRLARLGLADEMLGSLATAKERLLTDTYVRPPEDQRVYNMLGARDQIVRRRGDLARTIRSAAKGMGSPIPGSIAPEKLPPELEEEFRPALKVMQACDEAIAEYDAMLEQRAKAHPVAGKLLKISGVGPITALAFAVVIGDPQRFSHVRDVGAYLGMVVKRDQSGKLDPALGISKCGNGFMRRLLVQCSTHILGPRGKDSELRRWGLAYIDRRGPRSKKKARIAVGRKLAVRMLTIWKNDLTWLPFPNGAPDETPSATDGGADCAVPPDAHELAPREIAAAPTDPTQPCARPSGTRTDESAERRRSPRAATPKTGKPTAWPRRNASPAGRQGPATPSALAELACAGGPADPCLPAGRRVTEQVGGLNEVQPPADLLSTTSAERGRRPGKNLPPVVRQRIDGGAAS
jgi:transposase